MEGQPVLRDMALKQRLESVELVGKVEMLGRLTYKERLNTTALGTEHTEPLISAARCLP